MAIQSHQQERAMGTTIATRMRTSPGTFALIGQAVAAALLDVRQVVVAIKHRRQLADLGDSEDHRLADLGITRNDLLAAFSEPLWRDPTTALARRAGRQGKTRRRSRQ
jgi:uncharacterized protein YjiS (DUF1127 family)